MRLIAPTLRLRQAQQASMLLSAALTGLLLSVMTVAVPGQVAHAAAPVSYSISPASSSVQPDGALNITLTVKTTVAISGASVHIAYTNAAYASFQSAGTAQLSFVDYHAEQNDIVFICNDNNCPPGTYQIATITATAGKTGNIQVTFNPKETADPSLNLMAADGTSGTYDISPTAAPTTPPKKSSQSTFTVPKDNGSGGTIPQQITNDQLITQEQQAQDQYLNPGNVVASSSTSTSFWSAKNLVLFGLGLGLGIGLILFILLKFFGRSKNKGPGPYNGGGDGSGTSGGSGGVVVSV